MQQARAPRSVFDEILALLQQGAGVDAIARCRQALTRFPEDVNILGLLGAALGDQGQFQEAEEVLLRVIDLTPTFAKPYEDLGTLLVQQGRFEDAVPLLARATAFIGSGACST